jgi:hypothetical protein
VVFDKLDRTQRVKDAQAEATKEIKTYHLRKEEEFKDFEAQVAPLPKPQLAGFAFEGVACVWGNWWLRVAFWVEYSGGTGGAEGCRWEDGGDSADGGEC